jgi:hypothetical protein
VISPWAHEALYPDSLYIRAVSVWLLLDKESTVLAMVILSSSDILPIIP